MTIRIAVAHPSHPANIGDEGFHATMRKDGDRGGSLTMMDLDRALARIRELPADPRLDAIDSAVLSAIDMQRSAGLPSTGTLLGVAAGLALTIGLATSAIPGHDTPGSSLAPFGAPPALAPSTLLGSSE